MKTTKVLIIDDEMDFADTLAERLRKRGLDSKAANGADAAMAILDDGWIPDVVILDLQMPGYDGLATLDKLKARSPATEVIMLTGHPSTISGIQGMRKGLFDYLMKPVSIDILIEKIEAALQKRLSGEN
jgi:DNA-binding NtrC family response regulator